MAKKDKKAAKGVGTDERLSENYAGKEELEKEILDAAVEYFTRFESDREEIDDKNKLADAMYAAMQNRTLMSSEKSKGMDRPEDTRANVGSIIFHRQVNTKAAQLVGIMRSRPDLWKYEQVTNSGVQESYEDSLPRARQAMCLARWTLKSDEFNKKIPEFALSAYKYSNIFAMVEQKRTFKTKLCKEPIVELVPDPTTGEQIPTVVGERPYWDTVVADNYPSFSFPHIGNIYMDRWIPNVEKQNCIFILSLRNRSEIYNDVKMGFFDEKAYEKLDNGAFWDGTYGGAIKEDEADNREVEFSPSGTDMFLQWDILMRAPIDNGKWDDENPPEIYWTTAIGNSIGSAIVMRIERNPDPDGEFPLKEIRVVPDNSDTLYHTTLAEVIRSNYSADCTLLNLALDNMGNRAEPPMKVLDGEHRIKDFTWGKGKVWTVYRQDAIDFVRTDDVTQPISVLRSQIQDEIKQALGTDPATMGEYAGSRTPATEFIGVNQNTGKLSYMEASYILNQLLPWMGRKMMSYWQAFGLPNQVVGISDDLKHYVIRPKEVAGEYDITVDIVEDLQEDLQKQMADRELLQMAMGNIQSLQSENYKFDIVAFLKEWAERRKYNVNRFILPVTGKDAEEVATSRINAMLYGGVYVAPMQGENLSTHLKVAKGERVRWNGLEESQDPRAANLPLLDQYIAELQQMIDGAQTQLSAPAPGLSGPSTPGQAMGQEALGGDLGALLGG
jgi:hypothetical protein